MQFKQWLVNEVKAKEMAKHIDQDDADYLNQFPSNMQARALIARYEMLQQYANGRPVPNSVNLRGQQFNNVNFKLRPLYKKLKKQGIDPSSVAIPTLNNASQSIHYWRAVTMPRLTRRNNALGLSTEPTKKMMPKETWGRDQMNYWSEARKELVEMISKVVDNVLLAASRPTYTNHLNYYHWKTPENRIALITSTLHHLEKYFGDDSSILADNLPLARKIAHNHVTGQLQGGITTRRRVKSTGVNVADLLSQGWKHQEIAELINKTPKGQRATLPQTTMPLKAAI